MVHRVSVQEEAALQGGPPTYLPHQQVAPELLEMVEGQTWAMLWVEIQVKINVPRRGRETLQLPLLTHCPQVPQNTAAAAHRS